MTDTHFWSGWPGAFCLDCGLDDPTEYCVANHDDNCERPECRAGECPAPGTWRIDDLGRS